MNIMNDFLVSLGSITSAAKNYIQTFKKPITSLDPDDTASENNIGVWASYLDEQLQRRASDQVKYADYNLMDNEIPELSIALDVTTDYIVYPGSNNKTQFIQIYSDNPDVDKKLQEIIQRLNFTTEFYSMLRPALKYGDNVEEILLNQSATKLFGFKYVPIESISVNMKNGILLNDPMIIQYNSSNQEHAKLTAEECFHLCIKKDRVRWSESGKGISMLEKSRLIYRQLRLMEEGMIIRRLSRANQSYGIVVDVGDYQGEDALNYMDQYKKRITRRKYINPTTGKLSWKFNPLSVLEDILIPTRQGSSSTVIPLNRDSGSETIDDIQYVQNKLIYSTNVPKILIGKEEDINSKSTSDLQFSSFLRSIRKTQLLIEPEIIRLFTNALRIEGVKAVDYGIKIKFPVLGTIDAERELQVWKLKAEVATMLGRDAELFHDKWIYENIFGMDEASTTAIMDEIARLDAEAAAEADVQIDDNDYADLSQDDYEKEMDKKEIAFTKTSKNKKTTKERIEKALNSNNIKTKMAVIKQKLPDIFTKLMSDPDYKNRIEAVINLEYAKQGK